MDIRDFIYKDHYYTILNLLNSKNKNSVYCDFCLFFFVHSKKKEIKRMMINTIKIIKTTNFADKKK